MYLTNEQKKDIYFLDARAEILLKEEIILGVKYDAVRSEREHLQSLASLERVRDHLRGIGVCEEGGKIELNLGNETRIGVTKGVEYYMNNDACLVVHLMLKNRNGWPKKTNRIPEDELGAVQYPTMTVPDPPIDK